MVATNTIALGGGLVRTKGLSEEAVSYNDFRVDSVNVMPTGNTLQVQYE